MWTYLKLLARLIKRCCKSSNTKCNTYIKLTEAMTAPRWCWQKMNLFNIKMDKISFEWKSMFFAFSYFNNFFGTQGHIPAIFNLLDLMLSALSHSQSPQHSKTYLQSLENKPETHFILWQSRGNLFHFSKKAKILYFLGTKSCLKAKLWLQITIFFNDSESCMS